MGAHHLSSQTPLGERVPSATEAPKVEAEPLTRLKPLSGNVCLRPGERAEPRARNARSQTPLGERVPSASA